jgi:predicted acylesterase/phospholipase RssA
VHTDGGSYWDGLFSQNPPVRGLLDTHPDELWVIQINPTSLDSVPRSVLAIADRRNELAGNLSLYQELNFVKKIDQLRPTASWPAGATSRSPCACPRCRVPGRHGGWGPRRRSTATAGSFAA